MRSIGARQDLLRDGDIPTEAFIVLEGWGMRYKDLAEGRRRILAFLLPGDLCLNAPNQPMHHSVGSLTNLTCGTIPLVDMDAKLSASRDFARALWRQQLAANSRHLAWIANSGRPAYEALAHLLCELYTRAQNVGLADTKSCDFPPTQFDLACALGLTSVHVNRTVQQLRQDGLIELRGRKLLVLDSKRLREAAQFDRSYLHLSAA